MIILDTDHLTLLEWGGNEGRLIGAYLDAHALGVAPTTTIVNYVEQLRGWLGRLNSAKTVADQLRIYERIDKQRLHFTKIVVVPFDDAAATHYQRILKLRLRIGTMDQKIAAIALSRNAILLTRNTQDFARVPGLKFHDVSR